jgi:hypothetical protein
MGIFDRFRRTKPTAPMPAPTAPMPAPVTTPPEVPAPATIATFVTVDAVGTVELAGGGRLRFGRSACKGFEPVVGAAVIVEEVGSDPRGWKARRLTLDPADATYDARLSARDAQHGLASRTQPAEHAAAAARQLGIITLLLRAPLPSGHHQLRAWATAIGLPREGFDVTIERDLELVMPGSALLTYPGRAPFPRDGLELRDVRDDLDLGCAFLGLGVGLPGGARQERAIRGNTRDCWAPDGTLRRLSQLVRIFAPHATGVILHRAGDLVVAIDAFVRMLGELDDPACRPFAAWLDVGIARPDGQAWYGTSGMDVFGLPDVRAAVEPDDAWSRSRRYEAVLYACYRMIRDDRPLAAGDLLAVPVRLSIGAWPLELDDGGATTTYTVAERDGDLELIATDEPARDGALAPNLYQALFDRGLAALVPGHLVRDVRARTQQPLPHTVEVRARDDGRGFLIVTNGFGRAARFEVAAWVPHETFELVQLVGTLAASALAAPIAWQAGDTVAAPVLDLGIGGFVIADGGTVAVGAGPAVRVLLLIPLAEADYPLVRGGGAASWLTANPPTEAAWAPFVARVISAARS